MSDTVTDKISALPMLSRAQLQAEWRSALGHEPPANLRKQLLVPLLAYKLQEKAYGGLRPETKRRLRELAAGFACDPEQAMAQHQERQLIRPGTRLLRQWQGRTHHVTVIDHGLEYEGKRYASLSQVARQITGTRWSGPLFFGLKQTRKRGNRT